MTRLELQRQKDAWGQMFTDRAIAATHAITVAYNSVYGGTSSWCYRIAEGGERLRLPTSGVPVEAGVNRLPTVRHVPLEQVHADIRAWHYRVDRKLYGSRFHRLPEHLRSAFIGMIEHVDTNIHAHLIWTMPLAQADALANVAATCWQSITNGYGSVAVQHLHDGDGWATYCLKEQVGVALEGDPLRFVSSAPARPAAERP